ncbi:MAG: hypothetical protein Q8N87_02135 [bacterium]|nr:hypothetical protein [bacterium]
MYNLGGFILPDDEDFINLVEQLQSPKQICQYMQDNFTYEPHDFYTLSPYQLYQLKKGDCDDFSTFVVFILNYHSYETYQIAIDYKNFFIDHFIAVFREYDKLNFTDNCSYFNIGATDFREIVEYDCWLRDKIWSKYVVYSYDMDVIEEVNF